MGSGPSPARGAFAHNEVMSISAASRPGAARSVVIINGARDERPVPPPACRVRPPLACAPRCALCGHAPPAPPPRAAAQRSLAGASPLPRPRAGRHASRPGNEGQHVDVSEEKLWRAERRSLRRPSLHNARGPRGGRWCGGRAAARCTVRLERAGRTRRSEGEVCRGMRRCARRSARASEGLRGARRLIVARRSCRTTRSSRPPPPGRLDDRVARHVG